MVKIISKLKGVTIKTIYLIRHAKSGWSDPKARDFERGVKKRGKKDIKTIANYLKLNNITPDIILSSSALRAQITSEKIANTIGYNGKVHYMNELYSSDPETIVNILSLQDDDDNSIFVVGHNPTLTELANFLAKEDIKKIPTSGVVAIKFDIDSWEEIDENSGDLDFMIYPNLFRYYMPRQIRTNWDKREELDTL